jgi:hypothetical protein
MAVGGWERALRVLKAYRGGVEISSFLPEAMSMELDCLKELKRPDDLKALAREIVKRFPAHPVAEKAQGVL